MKKEQLIVIPLKSFNGIEYGTSRENVWKKLGKPNSSFKKTNISKVETDDYEIFYIYYDDNYNFEAVEIFNEAIINYNDDILSNKYSEVLNYFEKNYNDIEEDECGFISFDGSIGVYYENDDDLVDSILFGKENYYE